MSVLQDRSVGDTGAAEDSPGELFPISDYEQLTVGQIIPRLTGLTGTQLWRVRQHERRHGNRKPVLDAIGRSLGG